MSEKITPCSTRGPTMPAAANQLEPIAEAVEMPAARPGKASTGSLRPPIWLSSAGLQTGMKSTALSSCTEWRGQSPSP